MYKKNIYIYIIKINIINLLAWQSVKYDGLSAV
jgi:hypothetical protein